MPTGIYNTQEDVKASLEVLFLEYTYNCSAEQDAFACDGLGAFYNTVKEDRQTAYKLFAENCDKRKYGHSCHRLSLMLSKHGSDKPAKEDPMSKEHWVSWEKKGCDYGFATSCYNYGVYLTKQNGGVIPKSALEGFLFACRSRKGFQGCDRALTYMLVNNDWSKDALDLAKIGCQANLLISCDIGRQMYMRGIGGVEQNKQKSRFFEKRANYIRSVESTVLS